MDIYQKITSLQCDLCNQDFFGIWNNHLFKLHVLDQWYDTDILQICQSCEKNVIQIKCEYIGNEKFGFARNIKLLKGNNLSYINIIGEYITTNS